MSGRWYLVKRNWPQTSAICPEFAGVGGDIWPLDGVLDAMATRVHHALMKSRCHLQVGQGVELLCADRSQADAYFRETDRLAGGAWLLELTSGADANEPVDGFDIALPSGGGSLVESELITQGRAGASLNRWGLIESKEEAMKYMAARAETDDLEEGIGLELLAVRVLRHSSC